MENCTTLGTKESKCWGLQGRTRPGGIRLRESIYETFKSKELHPVAQKPEQCLPWVLRGVSGRASGTLPVLFPDLGTTM